MNRERHYVYEAHIPSMGKSYADSLRRIAEICDHILFSKGFNAYIPELLTLDENIQRHRADVAAAEAQEKADKERAELARLISIYGVPA